MPVNSSSKDLGSNATGTGGGEGCYFIEQDSLYLLLGTGSTEENIWA